MKQPFFSYYYGEGYFWFRIRGYGVHIKNFHRNPLLFSERHPLNRGMKIGKFHIKILKPYKFN